MQLNNAETGLSSVLDKQFAFKPVIRVGPHRGKVVAINFRSKSSASVPYAMCVPSVGCQPL